MRVPPAYPTGSPSNPLSTSQRPLRFLVANAHPGGRYPGVELPPTWFQVPDGAFRVPSALPSPGDKAGAVEGVRAMCLSLREAAAQAHAAGQHPVLVGGDHSLAMGSLAGALRQHERLAVIWVDAHADFNTMATSPTGNAHGMPLAAACGLGDARLTGLFERFVSPADVLLIGARDIDPEERELLAAQGIWQVGVAELRERGVESLVAAIAERFAGASVHLSFDFDAISREFFSATGTPVAEGLTPGEGEALLTALAASPLDIVSNDWVEFDPRHESVEACAAIARRLYSAFHGALPA